MPPRAALPQIFPPWANAVARVALVLLIATPPGALALVTALHFTPYITDQDLIPAQPVPFSHEHHVRELGIDCRYCHTSVETSSFAGLPPTETCMSCHSQIWTDSPMLEPVRTSMRESVLIRWNRVHDLPDYAYFNHSIHVNKGVGCSSCHGRVDLMPLMWKAEPLTMEWCLGCHRAPERHLRPQSEIFNMAWTPPKDQIARGRELIKQNRIPVQRLSDCYTCHR